MEKKTIQFELHLLLLGEDSSFNKALHDTLEPYFDSITSMVEIDSSQELQKKSYNLIITDKLSLVQEYSKKTKTLLLIDKGNTGELLEGISLNVEGYILQPIKKKQLKQLIEKTLYSIVIEQEHFELNKKLDLKYSNRIQKIIQHSDKQGMQLLEHKKKLQEKVQEEVLKNQKQQILMMQQSRLAQMGELISMIAHQWKQPLNTLSIVNQTISYEYHNKLLDEHSIQHFEDESKKQILQMSKTIDDFKNFFKPEKKKSAFTLEETIKHSISLLNSAFESFSIKVEYTTQIDTLLYGYPNELGQSIINILNNAKDALLENEVKDKQITISVLNNTKNVSIKIQDNGGGIPINILENIFDPYFSTKEEKNGTGIGLYMSKLIIEDHMDGQISASNEKDGALFHIVLPIKEELVDEKV